MKQPNCICEVRRDYLGYHGIRRWFALRRCEKHPKPTPPWLWRLYNALQPIRCRIGLHDYYSIAAGLCSACDRCSAGSWPYSPRVMHQYQWRPWLRPYVARAEDAEDRADYWQAACLEARGEDSTVLLVGNPGG